MLNMHFNLPTITTMVLVSIGAVISAPVLYQGFARRGKGVLYEKNFIIQRAPQYSTLVNCILVAAAHMANNGVLTGFDPSLLSQTLLMPAPFGDIVQWTGVAILISGLIFMVGGWISLKECFTTDAEVLDGHKVRRNGLLGLVMHPAYSGIIQSVLGAGLASGSLVCALFTVAIVAPLWLNRAKYEEAILIENLGPEYKKYAEDMKWRRLVPRFIPIGL